MRGSEPIDNDVKVSGILHPIRVRIGVLSHWLDTRVYKSLSSSDVLEASRFSAKHPRLQLVGLWSACDLLRERGDLSAARDVAVEIRTLTESQTARYRDTVVQALHSAALTFEKCRDFEDAVPIRERILKMTAQRFRPESPEVMWAKRFLATSLRGASQLNRAIAMQREQLEWVRSHTPNDRNALAAAEEQLGVSLVEAEQHEEAQGRLESARSRYGAANPKSRSASSWLARALSKQGELAASLAVREAAHATSQRAFGPEDRRTLQDLDQIAVTLWAMGERERARTIMATSLATRERVLGDDDQDTRDARERLSALRNELE
jgi:tetratricopeptide (TPR) repeat protein